KSTDVVKFAMEEAGFIGSAKISCAPNIGQQGITGRSKRPKTCKMCPRDYSVSPYVVRCGDCGSTINPMMLPSRQITRTATSNVIAIQNATLGNLPNFSDIGSRTKSPLPWQAFISTEGNQRTT